MVKEKDLRIMFLLIAFFVLIIDQASKILVNKFTPYWNFGIFTIHLTKNTGAGFGILQGWTFILGLVSLLAAFLVIFYYNKIQKKKIPQALFALFLGGVIGNMIDRLFRGYVIDFIDFSFWPSFNVADACITIAVIGMVVYFWKRT